MGALNILRKFLRKILMGKNKRAEGLLGKRLKISILYDDPAELNYFCPICEKIPLQPLETDEEWDYPDNLRWSEYNGFLYCKQCNLDIPTLFCMDNSTREKVRENTDTFLEFLKLIKMGLNIHNLDRP